VAELKRVLLVDDEEAILFAFRQMLKAASVEIDTASTLDDSKRLLMEKNYHAVIADLRLTGANNIEGFEVVKAARTLRPKAVIIVVTAYGGDETKQRVFDLGADFYLEKPVSPLRIKEILSHSGVY
jgi:DNA-binding response OmpR family regulator